MGWGTRWEFLVPLLASGVLTVGDSQGRRPLHMVMGLQKNLSLMLRAMGEMAIANPIFAHSQLLSLVRFVNPLLQSPMVGDVAYETMVQLSKCAEELNMAWDFISSVVERELSERRSLSLFEQVRNGLTISCKSGPLPVDSFNFIFPIIEKILSSPKKIGLHDDVLHMLFLHINPILPLPRVQMLSALNGVYAKEVHVRMASLIATKCIPATLIVPFLKVLRLRLESGLSYIIQKSSIEEVEDHTWQFWSLNEVATRILDFNKISAIDTS